MEEAGVMSITNEFCEEFGRGVELYVPSDEELFDAHLGSEQKLMHSRREKILYAMYDHGFIEHRSFTGRNVTSIEEAEFSGITSEDKARASSSYDTIASLGSGGEADAAYEELAEEVSRDVGAAAKSQAVDMLRYCNH